MARRAHTLAPKTPRFSRPKQSTIAVHRALHKTTRSKWGGAIDCTDPVAFQVLRERDTNFFGGTFDGTFFPKNLVYQLNQRLSSYMRFLTQEPRGKFDNFHCPTLFRATEKYATHRCSSYPGSRNIFQTLARFRLLTQNGDLVSPLRPESSHQLQARFCLKHWFCELESLLWIRYIVVSD